MTRAGTVVAGAIGVDGFEFEVEIVPWPPCRAGPVGEPPLGGTAGPPGAVVPVWRVVEVVPVETSEDLRFASTCVPPEPELTFVPVVAAGVEVEVEAENWDGVAVAVVCVEIAGADTVVDADAAGDVVLAETEALAAGVSTVALTAAEGLDKTDTLADAALGTLGVWGAAGSPPACAGTAIASQPAAQTRVHIERRRWNSRGINFTGFSPADTRGTIPQHGGRVNVNLSTV